MVVKQEVNENLTKTGITSGMAVTRPERSFVFAAFIFCGCKALYTAAIAALEMMLSIMVCTVRRWRSRQSCPN